MTGANTQQNRKEIESLVYDEAYSKCKYPVDLALVNQFLADSETAFQDYLKKFAPGADVLEIGCGDGKYCTFLSACKPKTLLGLDNSSSAIELCRKLKLNNNVKFVNGDIETESLPESSFDLIVDHEVASSIDFKNTIKKLARLLKPGGRIIGLECYGHNPLFNLNRKINYLMGKRTKWAITHIFNKSDITEAEKHLKLVDIEYYHLFSLAGAAVKKVPHKGLNKLASKVLSKMDKAVLKHPFFHKYAFKVLFHFQKITN